MSAGPATKKTEQTWLQAVRALMLRSDFPSAEQTLAGALAEYPNSTELCRILAGVYQRTGRLRESEALLRELLTRDQGDSATAFALAGFLTEAGRTAAASVVLRACMATESNRADANLAIHAIELLNEYGRQFDAAAIAEAAIAANPNEPRLHAYAGMLQLELGAFNLARRHYLFAQEHDERAWEWHVPMGLSLTQRYMEHTHPDIAMFERGLQRQSLSGSAQIDLRFALGKAFDDIGDYAEATRQFREGNAIAHRLAGWSRKAWRRSVQGILTAPRIFFPLGPVDGFAPIFVVGLPRSGTTLTAELLSRYPQIRNRGEQSWIANLAEQLALKGNHGHTELMQAAAMYVALTRRDDAPETRWFIDKQPLNFRYIDLILALFPDAKIIHCQRDARDTALSLWTQCFREPVHGYSCQFEDIAIVMRDHQRLMVHWLARHADSIRTLRYEALVASPAPTIADVAAWIGLPPLTDADLSRHGTSIDTASVWQARQPVHARSIGRWQRYAQHLPEIMDFKVS